MSSYSILTYLERRKLGYSASKKNVYDIFIEHLGYRSHSESPCSLQCNGLIETGNTFACKFSRNKNNLHLVGCATEHGELIVQNTETECHYNQYKRNSIHSNAIFNFAWAEPQMKLVTACGDQTSKLCNLHPSGKLDSIREFVNNSSVKCVMFCPGSSDVFCSGCMDGSIKVWDARINNESSVIQFDSNIPFAHGIYGRTLRNKQSKKKFGVSSVIYKNDLSIISCSSMDPYIKLWDLRKSYRQVKANIEPLPITKYFHQKRNSDQNIGYSDMIINAQSTDLYANCINNTIYRYSLESPNKMPICQYSGHTHETSFSKISISNDGHYLFSGCIENTGVIWLTDFPFTEKPCFSFLDNLSIFKKELSTSDWCADSSSLKLAASSDSMPKICSILPSKQQFDIVMKSGKTEYFSTKLFSKCYTVPIKSELKKKYQNETEKNMEMWYCNNENVVPVADKLPVAPKKKWEISVIKVKSLSSSKTSPQFDTTSLHSSPARSNQTPDVVTPSSIKKRKKSCLSPRCLIDQYLVPNRKREKLDKESD